MTIEEINDMVTTIQTKLDEIKLVVADIDACQSTRSKTILLAAASKLAEPLNQIQAK